VTAQNTRAVLLVKYRLPGAVNPGAKKKQIGGIKMKKFLTNAFSIQMLSGPATVRFDEIAPEDIPADVVSAVGHADTANVLSDLLGFEVPMNRAFVTLEPDAEIYVAQLIGGRLPEGSTTLPEGFTFKFYRVTLV
jgi:hypothetical protein